MKTFENETISWRTTDEMLSSYERINLQLRQGALVWLH